MRVLRALLYSCLLLLAVGGANANANSIETADAINTRLLEKLQSEQLAGVSWSIVDGADISSGAVGKADINRNTALTPEHRMHVGSIAKTMIALGLLRLANEGRVDLDAPVESLLPDIQFNNPWRSTHPVLVRHLLDHTAGLQDGRIWHFFSLQTTPDQPLQDAITRNRSLLNVRTQPGAHFSYSNTSFVLAGMLIEQITQQRYETWLEKNVLLPLNMQNSYFQFRTQNDDAQLAYGHLGDLTPALALPIAARSAGQFTTTPADMAKLAQFLMSDGRINNTVFIRSELLQAMAHARGTRASDAGLRVGYALGLSTRDRDGQIGRCHSGDILGFHGMLCVYPEYQRAFFLAINTDVDDADYASFDRILTDALSLPEQVETKSVPISEDQQRWFGVYRPLVSRFDIQTYPDLLSETATLSQLGDVALWQRGSRPAQTMLGADTRLLRSSDRISPSLALIEKNGELQIGDGLRTYQKTSEWLSPMLWLGFGIGVIGILGLCALPIIYRKRGYSWRNPIYLPLAVLIIAGIALYLQPFMSIGDLTIGSGLLTLGTAMLPFTAIWHGLLAWHAKQPWKKVELVLSIAALQWCITLAAFGLMPLNLWT